jgi:uncharacterized protein (TIGR00251 family)
MAILNLKVVPGARQDRVVGPYGADAIKLQVSAPPEDGKANAAVVRVLAEALGVKAAQVSLLAGHAQPRKVVRIDGLDEREVDARLGISRPAT